MPPSAELYLAGFRALVGQWEVTAGHSADQGLSRRAFVDIFELTDPHFSVLQAQELEPDRTAAALHQAPCALNVDRGRPGRGPRATGDGLGLEAAAPTGAGIVPRVPRVPRRTRPSHGQI